MTATVEQIDDLVLALAEGDVGRGTFHLKAYDLTGSLAAVFQAHVSMFSGTIGGTGMDSNYLLTDGAKNTNATGNDGLGLTGY